MHTHRRPRTLLTAAVAAVLALTLGLALGAGGSASAAGITKAAVKKIATKVVKKQAPKLSVAHATTADTATKAGDAATVGGRSAAELSTAPLVLTVAPGETYSGEAFWQLPALAPGTYELGVTAAVAPANVPSDVACGFADLETSELFGMSSTSANGDFFAAWVSSRTVRTVVAGESIVVVCAASGEWEIAQGGFQVTATRLTGATSGTLTELQPEAKRLTR